MVAFENLTPGPKAASRCSGSTSSTLVGSLMSRKRTIIGVWAASNVAVSWLAAMRSNAAAVSPTGSNRFRCAYSKRPHGESLHTRATGVVGQQHEKQPLVAKVDDHGLAFDAAIERGPHPDDAVIEDAILFLHGRSAHHSSVVLDLDGEAVARRARPRPAAGDGKREGQSQCAPRCFHTVEPSGCPSRFSTSASVFTHAPTVTHA